MSDVSKKVGHQGPMTTSGVTYEHAGQDYFKKRGLKRHAGAWSLWGLGVAAVISGDFSGWNYGIGEAGWGGMLVATIVITILYLFMVWSIAEMSSTMPHTGGAYSFGRSAMGPWGGFITGLAETIEYVITTAVVGTFAGLYADAITVELFDFSMPLAVWVVVFYVIFVALNSAGAAASFRFAMVIAIMALAVLGFFFIMALFSGEFAWGNLTDIAPEGGNSSFMPFGITGVLAALPFAIWFFLGIEELPLAAEETHTPQEDIPRGSIWGLFTLIVTAFLVLVLNPGIVGAAATADSDEPILEGFRAIFPNSDVAALLSLFALIGLVASFQGIMFAAGRNMYSLSRAGYYPKFLSLTGPTKVPYVALIVSAVIGVGLVVGLSEIQDKDGGTVAASLLNIAVFGAVIAYVLQMVSYLILRQKMADVPRPYKSPSGVVGAAIAAGIAGVTLIILPFNEDYRSAVTGVAIFFVIGLLYFALWGRHRLVLSPEEEFAVTHGKHGDPQAEGYDVTEQEEESGKAEYFPPEN